MASASRSTVTTASITLVCVIISMIFVTAYSQEFMSPNSAGLWGLNSRNRVRFPLMRRFDCSAICRKTGYSGYIGGCQCGFTLFTKRSKGASYAPDAPVSQQQGPPLLPPAPSDAEPNSFPFALNSMEESMASMGGPSSSDDAPQVSRENLFRSQAFRSAPVASSNSITGGSRAPCAGLCDRSQ